jgi:predicted CoA-binding protein
VISTRRAAVILSGDGDAFAAGRNPGVLTQTHTWAVVDCSPDPRRDSHRIAQLLRQRGFRVIPVNPAVSDLLGERCYPSVTAIPSAEGVEVVDIFRRADKAGAHVRHD